MGSRSTGIYAGLSRDQWFKPFLFPGERICEPEHGGLVFLFMGAWRGKKMSRSLKNVITLRDLTEKGFTGRQVRFFLLKTNYRKPLIFSADAMDEAAQALRRIDRFLSGIKAFNDAPTPDGSAASYVVETAKEMETDSAAALNDDLNVSGALGALARMMRKINLYRKTMALTGADANVILKAIEGLDSVIACLNPAAHENPGSEAVQSLINLREDARKNRNWAEADRLRNELLKMGIEVMDSPQGVRWLKKG